MIFQQQRTIMSKESLEHRVKTIAANIRKIRELRNYTQEYLAMKLEISQNAYSKIELGYTKITLERLFHIATILQVDMIELLQADGATISQLVESKVVS